MPQKPSIPTAAAPYRCQWTTAADDITANTANTSPMIFPREELDGANFVNLCFATAAVVNFKGQLVLTDRMTPDTGAEIDETIIRAVDISITTAATARRTDADGAAGYYISDAIVDIRGVGSSGDIQQWYLCLTDVGQSTVRLLRYKGTKDGS